MASPALAASATAAPPQVVSEPAATPYSPRLAMTDSGRAYVSWLGYFEDEPGTPDFGQMASVGPDGAVTAPADLGGPGADVVAGPGEDATAVWQAEGGNLRLQRISPDGSLSPSVFIAADTEDGGVWGSPAARVAVGPDGTATVVWLNRRDLFAKRIAPDGTPSPTRRVAGTELLLDPKEIHAGVDSRNRTTIAFMGERGPAAVRLKPDGSVLGRDSVKANGGWQLDADLTAGGRGAIAWRTRHGISLTTLSKRGTLGGVERADNGTRRALFDPRVAVAPSGAGIVAWTSQNENEQRSVVYATFGRGGAPAKARTAARRARGPAVATGAAGAGPGLAVAWTEHDFSVELATVRKSGKLARPRTVAPAHKGAHTAGLNLAYDSAGRPALAWTASSQVLFARP